VNGKLFPCEKVSELSEIGVLGDIRNGIVLEKAINVMNPEYATHSKCKNCWAYQQCSVCVAVSNAVDDSPDGYSSRCLAIRSSIDTRFKNYCVLKELGYTFADEQLQRL
jgi:uncharacterized protein